MAAGAGAIVCAVGYAAAGPAEGRVGVGAGTGAGLGTTGEGEALGVFNLGAYWVVEEGGWKGGICRR